MIFLILSSSTFLSFFEFEEFLFLSFIVDVWVNSCILFFLLFFTFSSFFAFFFVFKITGLDKSKSVSVFVYNSLLSDILLSFNIIVFVVIKVFCEVIDLFLSIFILKPFSCSSFNSSFISSIRTISNVNIKGHRVLVRKILAPSNGI